MRCMLSCVSYLCSLNSITTSSSRKKKNFQSNKCSCLRSCRPTCGESWGQDSSFLVSSRSSVAPQVWLDACLPRNYRPISHHFLIASHTATPTQWSHKSASRGSVGSSTLDMKLAASLPSDSQKLSSGNASDALIKRFRSLHIASEWKLQPNCQPNMFIPTRVITDEWSAVKSVTGAANTFVHSVSGLLQGLFFSTLKNPLM